MEEKKLVPKLRFPGFTEPWEQRKLGSLATVEMNKRIFKEQTTTKGDIPFYKIGTFGSDADSFISRDLFEEYKNKYPYPNIGDILISASGSIGRTVVYNGEDAYYQDSNIVWLNHNGKIDNSFLLQFYNQVKWAGLEGSTIKRLYNKNILETYIAVPKIEEQRLIGEFFKLVDSSITLHQRKLEHLKLKKKSLLQKLFPKEGEVYPELRFPGFTDPWEQRKLGEDILSIHTGTNILGSETNDGIPLLKMGNLRNGYFDFSKLEYLPRNIDIDKQDIIKYGDFLFNTRNTLELVGKGATWTMESKKFAFNGNIARFDLKSDIDTIFFNYLYNTSIIMRQIHARATGTTSVAAIYTNTLNNLIYRLPIKDEQTKIGNFFQQLDSLITLHQRKLEHLQLLKKALLQQLFV